MILFLAIKTDRHKIYLEMCEIFYSSISLFCNNFLTNNTVHNKHLNVQVYYEVRAGFDIKCVFLVAGNEYL